MIHKRLVGVITVKQGWAVQSFGYRRHLPMGRPEIVAENLDRWGVDEILLQCIDRSAAGLGPDLALLERINRKGLATPLTYQGGIRNVADGVAAVQAGAERIALDSLLRDHPQQAAALAVPLGALALLGALPLALGRGTGSEMRRPLGIAIVGGLLVSQMLTLFTTPVVYLALDRFSSRPAKRASSPPPKPAPAPAPQPAE